MKVWFSIAYKYIDFPDKTPQENPLIKLPTPSTYAYMLVYV